MAEAGVTMPDDEAPELSLATVCYRKEQVEAVDERLDSIEFRCSQELATELSQAHYALALNVLAEIADLRIALAALLDGARCDQGDGS